MATGVTSSPVSLGRLLAVYTKIGLLGFGGGYAVLSFIRSELVDQHHWIPAEQFDHVVEMASFAPGATTINVLAALAYRIHGFIGMVAGTIAVLWPSFLLVVGLARLTAALQNPVLLGVLHGMEIAVIGLLLNVVVTLGRDVPRTFGMLIPFTAGWGLTLVGWNPAAIILVIAAGGILTTYVQTRRPSR
ncbi:MAG: chromate transporter [Sulfobacillus sp.]|nr:chromate transporter [Sulfobacillus sp.]